MSTKSPPAHELRIGLVKAAIWKNGSDRGAFYSVTLVRLYRDGDEWKQTASLGRDDLLPAAKVLDHAHTWICEETKPALSTN